MQKNKFTAIVGDNKHQQLVPEGCMYPCFENGMRKCDTVQYTAELQCFSGCMESVKWKRIKLWVKREV